jgi:hypothetical protein
VGLLDLNQLLNLLDNWLNYGLLVFLDQDLLHNDLLLCQVLSGLDFFFEFDQHLLDLLWDFSLGVVDDDVGVLVFWHNWDCFLFRVSWLDWLDWLNCDDLVVVGDFVVDDCDLFDYHFSLDIDSLDIDDILGDFFVVGHFDLLDGALFQLFDFVLDVLDDLLDCGVRFDDLLGVIGDNAAFSGDTDFGLGLGDFDFADSALLDDLVLSAGFSADHDSAGILVVTDNEGCSDWVADLSHFHTSGFDSLIDCMAGSDSLPGLRLVEELLQFWAQLGGSLEDVFVSDTVVDCEGGLAEWFHLVVLVDSEGHDDVVFG